MRNDVTARLDKFSSKAMVSPRTQQSPRLHASPRPSSAAGRSDYLRTSDASEVINRAARVWQRVEDRSRSYADRY